MLRSFRRYLIQKKCSYLYIQRQTFLTNEYKCTEDWNTQISSSILKRVNLNDFYNVLDQNYSSKGVISAIDVDMFANAVNEAGYLEELKDLLHKLRLSAETGNTLESTHYATIRNFIEHGNIQDLVQILKDPINFGIFLDYYSANILLDKLLVAQNFELAANVASVYMWQEDFSNEITNTMSQYACYKYLSEYKEKEEHPTPETTKKDKVEEIKIRVKFLRNPYFDDHFDITDLRILSGKTLAWISKNSNDNVSNNLQIIGWFFYQKHNKLLLLCEELLNIKSFKLYPEVLELIMRESKNSNEEAKNVLDQCIDKLKKAPLSEINLEDSVKNSIENAINKTQKKDISVQKQLFKNFEIVREQKLKEQSERLDRAKRILSIEEKQKELQTEEQKLWFFDNEETIDLQIEEKEQLIDTSITKEVAQQKSDENYIPPEILPKRKL